MADHVKASNSLNIFVHNMQLSEYEKTEFSQTLITTASQTEVNQSPDDTQRGKHFQKKIISRVRLFIGLVIKSIWKRRFKYYPPLTKRLLNCQYLFSACFWNWLFSSDWFPYFNCILIPIHFLIFLVIIIGINVIIWARLWNNLLSTSII